MVDIGIIQRNRRIVNLNMVKYVQFKS